MRFAFLGFLALLDTGCHRSATQLVVVIDTDYDVPTEMSQVRVRTLSAEGAEVSIHDFSAVSSSVAPQASEVHIPFSFAVVPRGGDSHRSITLEIEARGSSDNVLSARSVVTGFIKNRSLFLSVFLPKSCMGLTCPTGETCTDVGCVNEIIDPHTLPSVTPGHEIDGAIALQDAGTVDAGMDSGDPNCPGVCGGDCDQVQCESSLCECLDHCHCLLQCTGVVDCNTRCRNTSCTVNATSSSSANVNCARDSRCTVLGNSTSGLRIDCGDDAVCDVDCRNSAGCHLNCDGDGAKCLLRCDNASGCKIDSCSSEDHDCAGNIFVCGRSCP